MLARLGPEWTLIIKKPNGRTMAAMEAEGVAEFRDLIGVLFGRLSPAGMALRDVWLSSAAVKAAPELWQPKFKRQHSGQG